MALFMVPMAALVVTSLLLAYLKARLTPEWLARAGAISAPISLACLIWLFASPDLWGLEDIEVALLVPVFISSAAIGHWLGRGIAKLEEDSVD
ncbi:MAG: hypothetical protein IBJ12_11900 [Sphingomonadaceae bacterium]|nr:hypothetical protein [Sphingomonadaceae bacterium]